MIETVCKVISGWLEKATPDVRIVINRQGDGYLLHRADEDVQEVRLVAVPWNGGDRNA